MFGKKTAGQRREPRTFANRRQVSPRLEGLESRELLTATPLDGGQWTYGSRITYSFVPDGTSIGGVASNLNATLTSSVGSNWQAAIQKAAALWEAVANINLAQVSDNGEAEGSSGNQQGDPNVGDIRFAMIPQSGSVLAFTLLPPPINGGTDAGDIVFNSNVTFGTGGYDLTTVAIHEFGHALGLDHSPDMTDVLYAYYNGTNQTVSSNDTAGLDSLYGAAPTGTSNGTAATATPVTLNANGTATISNAAFDGGSSSNWYSFVAPANTNGTFKVTLQTSGLSSASPRVQIYASNGTTGLAQTSAPNVYGTIITASTSVTAGTKYYVKALPASAIGAYGAYGLQVTFTSSTPAAVTPPNTTVASQPDQGGGSINDSATAGGSLLNKVAMNLQQAVKLIQTTGQVPLSTIIADLPAFLEMEYLLLQAGKSASALADLSANVVYAFASGQPAAELAASQKFLANVVQAGSITTFGDYYTTQSASGDASTSASLPEPKYHHTTRELAQFRADVQALEVRYDRSFGNIAQHRRGSSTHPGGRHAHSGQTSISTLVKSDSTSPLVILTKDDAQASSSPFESISKKATHRNS